MHYTIFQLFALSVFVTSVAADLALPSRRSHSAVRRRKNWSVFSNATVPYGDDPSELVKRDGSKYVFMHHIVGNTYNYVLADWKDDIQQIQAKGIDAIALNIGGDEWQKGQIQSAYAAAVGTNMKLFISFDFTEMGCGVDDIIARVKTFSDHPNQFKVNGKTFISSYSGDCLGNSGWQTLKSATNGYVMPFIWGLEGNFNNWPSLDSWYCWGCAWPQGNYPKNTDDDNYYISQLGNRYAATISAWLYTHYSYKNFYLRGDDWLIVSRWEELMAMRNQLTFVEMVTWNDFGESDYFGPIKGDQPSGTTWATGYPHTAWFDLSQYYITAFKTGTYPTITTDVIYFWARPHPAGASASGDSLGKPKGNDWTQDTMWAAVFATGPATVTLKCGGSSGTFNVVAGVNKLKIGLAVGKMTVQMARNGQTIIDYTPAGYNYVSNPVTYNYNAWVGSASATPGSSTSSTTTTTTSTSTSTTSTTPSSTPTNGYSYIGCYQDDNARVLTGSSSSDPAQTIAKCQAKCTAGGFAYSGVEYGIECYCGSSLRSNAISASESECSKPCGGDSSQTCGDGWRIRVYKASTSTTTTTTSTTSTTSTATTPTSTTWTALGCVAEGTTGSRRALTAASYSQTDMTPQVCQNLCSSYKYAGVEYGVQCYCGDTLTNNGATGAVIASSNCQNTCGGDSSQKCGGSWTMNVYTKSTGSSDNTQWTSAGCYVDANTRMLRGSYVRQDGMTTDKCISMCTTGGYTMAATEDGKECFCGSQLYKEGGAGVAAGAGQCTTPCDGNSAQVCGGGWRGNLYLKPGTTI